MEKYDPNKFYKSCPWVNFDFSRISPRPLEWKWYKLLLKVCKYFYDRIEHNEIRKRLHEIAEIIRNWYLPH